VLRRLLDAPSRPVTLAVDHKAAYDDDDMKVSLDGARLRRVGKQLPPADVDGESIGMMVFRGPGPALFAAAIDRALRRPEALRRWYLSVVDEMAQEGHAFVRSIQGLEWTEVDCAEDLDRAEKLVARWADDEAGAPDQPPGSPTSARTSRRSSGVSTSTAASGNGSVTGLTRTPSRRDARAAPSASDSHPSA
jgi:choline kinase